MTTTVAPSPARPVTLGRVIRSEWIKLTSLTGTWIRLAVALAVSGGLMALLAHLAGDMQLDSGANAEALGLMGMPYWLGLIIVATLAASLATTEYSTGQIRPTLVAAPRRAAVVLAKAAVATVVAIVMGVAMLALQYVVSLPGFAKGDLAIDLGAEETVRTFGAMLLAIVMLAWLALGLGFLVRSSVFSNFTVVALLFVLPTLLPMFDHEIVRTITKVLPQPAVVAVSGTGPGVDGALSPVGGLIALLAWGIVPLAAAIAVLRTRDV